MKINTWFSFLKAAIVAAILLLCANRTTAQALNDSLIVFLKNGELVSIPLADIQKITFDSLTASVATASVSPSLLQVSPSYPNPLYRKAMIEYSIAKPGNVTIAFFDAKGSLIRRITMPNAPAGSSRLEWDGFDDRGMRVPSGSYIYEVRFQDEVQTRQMVVIN